MLCERPMHPYNVESGVMILHLRRLYHAVHRANTSTLAQVGYMAERVTATPASRHKPVVHRCEVLAAPDGSGPLFR